jgi:hypothetical protein
MSVKFTDRVWRKIQVPALEQHVLCAIADACSDEGHFYTSVEYLSHKTNLSERTIQTFKKGWLKSGAITVIGKFNFITGNKTLYKPGDTPSFGRSSAPVYLLDLSVLPQKKSWEEIKGRGSRKPVGAKDTEATPAIDEKGAAAAPFQEKGANYGTKGADCEPKGCKPAIHNIEELSVQPLVQPLTPSAKLNAPDSEARLMLDQLNEYMRLAKPGVDCTMSPADYRNFWNWRGRNPNFTIHQFFCALRNRALSPINQGTPIHMWIGRVDEFLQGPLDRFWQPLTLCKTKSEIRVENTLDNVRGAMSHVRARRDRTHKLGTEFEAQGFETDVSSSTDAADAPQVVVFSPWVNARGLSGRGHFKVQED